MYLSKFSDYAFRILIYLAKNQNKLCTVEELANNFQISEHHVKKIVHKLAKTEYITSIKGRNGGLSLGMNPKDINLGEVLEITEDNLDIVECFCEESNTCNLNINCKFKKVIRGALDSFIGEFKNYSLDDIV